MRTFDGIFWKIFIPFIILIITILFFPYWFTSRSCFNLDFSTTGEVGDTIGGILGPFIAIAAAILTFFAFWVQFKANEQQRNDIRIERFENKFYELLRLHKENISEIKINYYNGSVEMRKAFVSMFNELRYTYWICKKKYEEMKANNAINEDYSDERLVKLAYIFFYSGVGSNSNMISRAINENPDPEIKFNDVFFEKVLESLKELKERKDLRIPLIGNDGNEILLKIRYLPWGGHQSRLGHYYRHLFQTVKFVVAQPPELLQKEKKIEYLRTLRAQLSDHEQLMLYYNAISGFGGAWINDIKNNNTNYFTEYYMIHNIPLPLANFGIRPDIKFARQLQEDETLFDWLE